MFKIALCIGLIIMFIGILGEMETYSASKNMYDDPKSDKLNTFFTFVEIAGGFIILVSILKLW